MPKTRKAASRILKRTKKSLAAINRWKRKRESMHRADLDNTRNNHDTHENLILLAPLEAVRESSPNKNILQPTAINSYGSIETCEPTKDSRVSSAHLVDGAKSYDPRKESYNATIFSKLSKTNKSSDKSSRFLTTKRKISKIIPQQTNDTTPQPQTPQHSRGRKDLINDDLDIFDMKELESPEESEIACESEDIFPDDPLVPHGCDNDDTNIVLNLQNLDTAQKVYAQNLFNAVLAKGILKELTESSHICGMLHSHCTQTNAVAPENKAVDSIEYLSVVKEEVEHFDIKDEIFS